VKHMNVTPMIESAAIQHRVQELATQIAADYGERSLVMVGILTGAARFMMDLMTALPEAVSDRVDYDFIGAASYDGHESTGQVDITLETAVELRGRHILVVDGIADTGLTMQRVLRYMEDQSPQSVKTCVLLDKPSRRRHAIGLDYTGFEIEDVFVVGYGLDADQCGRSLRYIGVADEDY
jgi:hypoxanthine phosphoribosyltransferase